MKNIRRLSKVLKEITWTCEIISRDYTGRGSIVRRNDDRRGTRWGRRTESAISISESWFIPIFTPSRSSSRHRRNLRSFRLSPPRRFKVSAFSGWKGLEFLHIEPLNVLSSPLPPPPVPEIYVSPISPGEYYFARATNYQSSGKEEEQARVLRWNDVPRTSRIFSFFFSFFFFFSLLQFATFSQIQVCFNVT